MQEIKCPSISYDHAQNQKQRYNDCRPNCTAALNFRRAAPCFGRAVENVKICFQTLLSFVPKKQGLYHHETSCI